MIYDPNQTTKGYMKRLYVLIFISMLMFSCKQEGTNSSKIGTLSTLRIVEDNGHTYILWIDHYKGAMIHDPDCKCKNKKD